MNLKCGDVVLVLYPFTDNSGSKVRPAIVVSADVYNNGADVVVVPVSSTLDDTDSFAYVLTRSHSSFGPSGLRHESSVKWTKPMALSKRIVKRRIGALTPQTLDDITTKLASMFQ